MQLFHVWAFTSDMKLHYEFNSYASPGFSFWDSLPPGIGKILQYDPYENCTVIVVWLSLIHTNVKSFHSGACFILYHAFIKLHGFLYSPGIQGPKGWSARTKEIFFHRGPGSPWIPTFPYPVFENFPYPNWISFGIWFLSHDISLKTRYNSKFLIQFMVPKKWFLHLYIGIFSLIMISESYDIFIFSSDIFCSVTIPYKVDSLTLVTLVQQFPFWYFVLSLCRLTCFILTRPRQFPYFFFFFLLNLLSLKMVFVLSSKIEKTQNEMILECSLLPSGHQ